MTRSFLFTVLLVFAVASAAVAGTITGTVSPGKSSVVYVDTIQGKTFPAPTQQPVMDQKGLAFRPTSHGRAAGDNGGVPEQRQRATQRVLAVDQRQQEAEPQPGNLAQGRKAALQVRSTRESCRCCATCTRRCRATSSSVRPRTSPKPTRAGTTRSRMFPTASTTSSPGMKARRRNPSRSTCPATAKRTLPSESSVQPGVRLTGYAPLLLLLHEYFVERPTMLSASQERQVDRDWLNTNFPCMMACPAHTNAGRYVALIAEGRFEEAYQLSRATPILWPASADASARTPVRRRAAAAKSTGPSRSAR